MDWEQQRELLPHYAAVVVLVGLYVVGVRAAFGRVVPLVDIAGVAVVVLAYPTVVRLLGVGPSAWDDR